jgi:[acyl-carrier-protein] S-malonyltransferase
MLAPWLDGATDRLASWSALTGLDLERLGTTAEAGELRDTAVAQPLLTAAALLSGRALIARGLVPDVVCGHSIGEIPALALAGVLSDEDAIRLAAGRGAAMARAAAIAPTGMAAVLGGDRDEVVAAGTALGLELATVNVTGQVVLGGPVDALDALAAEPPTGSRVRRLEVAGAFHTRAMAPAAEDLAALVAELTPGTPTAQVVANADGAVVTDGAALLGRLVAQLTGPVRFDLCLQAIAALEPTTAIELAPGGTLTGMAKRALPGVTTIALKSADDVPAQVTA